MPDQNKKTPEVFFWIATWFSACLIFFIISKIVSGSILSLYENLEDPTTMTRFLVFFIKMNGGAWSSLFAVGVMALILGSTIQRKKSSL